MNLNLVYQFTLTQIIVFLYYIIKSNKQLKKQTIKK